MLTNFLNLTWAASPLYFNPNLFSEICQNTYACSNFKGPGANSCCTYTVRQRQEVGTPAPICKAFHAPLKVLFLHGLVLFLDVCWLSLL